MAKLLLRSTWRCVAETGALVCLCASAEKLDFPCVVFDSSVFGRCELSLKYSIYYCSGAIMCAFAFIMFSVSFAIMHMFMEATKKFGVRMRFGQPARFISEHKSRAKNFCFPKLFPLEKSPNNFPCCSRC